MLLFDDIIVCNNSMTFRMLLFDNIVVYVTFCDILQHYNHFYFRIIFIVGALLLAFTSEGKPWVKSWVVLIMMGRTFLEM